MSQVTVWIIPGRLNLRGWLYWSVFKKSPGDYVVFRTREDAEIGEWKTVRICSVRDGEPVERPLSQAFSRARLNGYEVLLLAGFKDGDWTEVRYPLDQPAPEAV